MTSKDKPPRKGGKDSGRGGSGERKNVAARSASGGAPRKAAPARGPKPEFAGDAAIAGKPERISKIMARAGVASRRDVERMIMEGRVSLNGKLLETPVVNATLGDRIEVDGQPIRGIERTRMWLYHKSAGLVTTNADPEGRPTVFENLPPELPRVLSIGRLDINTEGLLLLTNDGGLSRVLELPSTGWLRRYRVRAHGEVDQAALDRLKDGIAVEGVLYGPIEATLDRVQGHNVWITMGLREGKNREIKNVLGALGLEVNRLIRISYGPFQLGDLPEGQVVEVRGRMLRDQLGPRLIAEAKANFDAPIHDTDDVADEADAKPANRSGWKAEPARAEKPRRERSEERGSSPRGTEGFGDRSRGEDRPRGEKFRGDGPRGDRARGDGPRGGKSFGDRPRGGARGDDDASHDQPARKRTPAGTSRTTNVWMAPGARPERDGKPRASARAEAEKLFSKRPDENTRRVVVNRADDDNDWIRADAPPARKPGEGEGRPRRGERGDRERSFGDRSFGDRPQRGERSGGDQPRGERRERAGGEGFRQDRPRGAGKPFGERGDRDRDRPFGERSSGERRSGDRPFGERPRTARSDDDSPRPSGRPSGGKPFGGKPAGKGGFREDGPRGGGKPFGGGKPSGGKGPGNKGPGGKPGGSRPSGDRPAGNRGGPRGADRRR